MSISATDRATKLTVHVDQWWHLVRTTRHKAEILQSLIERAKTNFDFRNGRASSSISLLAHTLLFDLIKDLSILTLDRDKNAASLNNIVDMLDDVEVQNVLRADATIPSEEFDALLSTVLKSGRTIREREVSAKIKTARDKSSAHFEIQARDGIRGLYDLSQVKLVWGDPGRLLAELESFGCDLTLLVLGRYFTANARRALDRESALALWGREHFCATRVS